MCTHTHTHTAATGGAAVRDGDYDDDNNNNNNNKNSKTEETRRALPLNSEKDSALPRDRIELTRRRRVLRPRTRRERVGTIAARPLLSPRLERRAVLERTRLDRFSRWFSRRPSSGLTLAHVHVRTFPREYSRPAVNSSPPVNIREYTRSLPSSAAPRAALRFDPPAPRR